MIGILGFFAFVQFIMVVSPPRVRLSGDTFEWFLPHHLTTPAGNIRTLAYNGNGLALAFADLDQIHGANEKLRDQWLKSRLKTGSHLVLPGFTLAQAEAVRSSLGVAPPDPREPAGEVETFYRHLTTTTAPVFVTWLLIAVNLVVFGFMLAQEHTIGVPSRHTLLAFGANFGPLTTHGEWWRLASCIFVHIGLMHLVVNMWVLSDIGPLMERLLGPIGFLILYLFSGLAGSAASLAWNPFVTGAGASGAIFGLFGALLGIMFFSRGSIPTAAVRDLRTSGLLFLAFNFLGGLFESWIDHAAHLGGAVVGLLGGLILAGRSPAAKAGRRVRDLVLLGVAIAGVALLIAVLPRTNPDLYQRELAMDEFQDMEKKCVEEYDSVLSRLRKSELTEEQAADLIRDEVRAPWQAFRARIGRREDVPPRQISRKTWPLFLDYLETRQEFWELFEKALRTDDPRQVEAARKKAHQVEQILEKLKAADG
jgi:rhomboid protease GluP